MALRSIAATLLVAMGAAWPSTAQQDAPSSSPNSLTVLGDRLIFSADDGIHGRELWLTDGEPGHARLLKDTWMLLREVLFENTV